MFCKIGNFFKSAPPINISTTFLYSFNAQKNLSTMNVLKIPSQMEYNTAILTVYIAFTVCTAHTAYTVLTALEKIRLLCLYTYNIVII